MLSQLKPLQPFLHGDVLGPDTSDAATYSPVQKRSKTGIYFTPKILLSCYTSSTNKYMQWLEYVAYSTDVTANFPSNFPQIKTSK